LMRAAELFGDGLTVREVAAALRISKSEAGAPAEWRANPTGKQRPPFALHPDQWRMLRGNPSLRRKSFRGGNAFRLYLELAKRVGWGTERRLSAV
jgi:hypothetical protein